MLLQVATLHKLKHKVMERHPLKIACRSVPKPVYYVRMTNPIESNSLVLKVFNQRSLEIGVEIILKKNIKSLDHNQLVRRLVICEIVLRNKDLGIAPTAEPPDDIVPFVQP